jgi:glycosyltransferase involved in cell wall biosynthesis/SAM-dependent methyltransferase
MIMKDEEEELPLVLSSAAGLADEIVIYDTGSTDRSVAVARELGATVVEGYWDDDFSRARNEALEHCGGEWILWLDADEAIHGDFAAFRSRLSAAQVWDAYLVAIESIEGGGLGVRAAFHASRVFRREHCQWFGPIHEQVRLRGSEARPQTTVSSELRILHRGYTKLKWSSKDLIERNLRIARRALEDSSVDRPRALFDYGRTLTESDDPHLALAPLREASETTSIPTLRRAALRMIFYVHLASHEFDEATEVIDEMRVGLSKTISTDVMGVKLLLWKKDYEACLEAIDRLPFADTDEDGFELGRASVAWVKAHALDGLGRHGDAADALLDALRTHGQLDESLGALVGLLHKAGRGVFEVAEKARPESMPVLAAMASRLPLEDADELLASFAERYPDRLEPLAAARDVARRLGVPRAMWWSDRLRRAGLGEMCPLVAIARDETLEPLFRLLAAAGGYLSFGDQRLVPAARAALAAIDVAQRAEAHARVGAISPGLGKLLGTTTQAVHLTRRAASLDGYVTYSTRRGSDFVDPGELPLGDATVHDLVAEDVLAQVAHDRTGAVIREWARVLCGGGRLRLEVPNLEALPRLLADARGAGAESGAGSLAELRRALFGGRRFGEDGGEEANADAWSFSELEATLAGIGFLVEQRDESAAIRLSARRDQLDSKQAGGKVLPVCVLVVASEGAGDLLQRLRALSETAAGVDFETVVFVNGPDEKSRALLKALEGDVTTVASDRTLELAAAIDEAAALGRSETVVVLSPRARPIDGWLARLVSPLRDPAVALSCAAVVDGRGLVVHAGFDLAGDSSVPVLEVTARSAYLRAEAALGSDEDVDACGPEAFAIRRELFEQLRGLAPGWSEVDAVIDLSLRARARGLRCVVAGGCTVAAEAAPSEALSRERLAWHWSGRAALRPVQAPRVSASSLMPSSTLIERVSTVLQVPEEPRSGGVNLVGDFADSITRSYAAALASSDMRVSKLQWAGGAPAEVGDDIAFAYSTTLLCLDGDQLVDYIGEVGTDTLRSRRTIIAWGWPLARPTPSVAAQAAMVGEIWVPSSFAEAAMRRVVPRPVFVVPPPVLARQDASRADAGLPSGFVFATVARLGRGREGDAALSNPLGAVEAFKLAFPAPTRSRAEFVGEASGEPVLCVVLHGRKTAEVAELCRLAAEGRPDVAVLETGDPDAADAASLTADCLVSLHRASAFGSDLARALSVGCPVVATGYGGPMEFLSEEYAELVAYSTTTSTAGAYPYPAGTEWAEPDLDGAAAALRLVFDDLAAARRKAWLGRSVVMRRCGPKAATRSLKRRLGDSPFSSPEARDRQRLGASR